MRRPRSRGLTGFFSTGLTERISLEEELRMAKRPSAEQVIAKLRQVEVLAGQGKSVAPARKEAGVSEQNWRCCTEIAGPAVAPAGGGVRRRCCRDRPTECPEVG